MTEPINYYIERLKAVGVNLTQISEELNYRDEAGKESRWDDDLYDYSTDDLEQIELAWHEADNA